MNQHRFLLLHDISPSRPQSYTLNSKGGSVSLTLAQRVGDFWQGGSKLSAVRSLLEATLENRRDRFCSLMIGLVKKGIAYRSKKKTPLTRNDIKELNELIVMVGFKIPELWDPKFLDSLPSPPNEPVMNAEIRPDTGELRDQLIGLERITPHTRGFAFEKFLNTLFAAFSLNPRHSFKLVGEQIDGSFELDHEIYLLVPSGKTHRRVMQTYSFSRRKSKGKHCGRVGFLSAMQDSPMTDSMRSHAEERQT